MILNKIKTNKTNWCKTAKCLWRWSAIANVNKMTHYFKTNDAFLLLNLMNNPAVSFKCEIVNCHKWFLIVSNEWLKMFVSRFIPAAGSIYSSYNAHSVFLMNCFIRNNKNRQNLVHKYHPQSRLHAGDNAHFRTCASADRKSA